MKITVTWDYIVRFFLLLCVAFFLVAQFSQDFHPYFDSMNYFLCYGLCALLFVASGRLAELFPLFRPVTLVVFLFFILRLVVVAYFPDWLLLADRVTYKTLEEMLVYVLLGSFFAYLAIILASWAAERFDKGRPREYIHPGPFYAVGAFSIFSSVLMVANHFIFGFVGSGSGSAEHLNFFSRYVIRLFDPMAFLIITAVGYYLLPRKNDLTKKFFSLTILAFFVGVTVTGSRAAAYEALVLYLALISTVQNKFPVTVSVKRVFALLLLIAATPILFDFATSLRGSRYTASTVNFYSLDSYHPVFQHISRRVSLVESTMFPLSVEDMRMNDVSELVNVETTVQSTINRLVPGKPFGRMLGSEYLWCYLIRKDGCYIFESLERTDVVGFEWGMYGIGYQLFGYTGGQAFIFVSCFLIAFFAQMVRQMQTWGALSVYCLANYALQFWVKNLGVDNWFDRFAHQYFLMGLYLVVISWISRTKAVQASQMQQDIA